MRLNIDVATAAIILAQALNGAAMPQAAMAEGGKVQAGEPVLVGERGPEVFVPGTGERLAEMEARLGQRRPGGNARQNIGACCQARCMGSLAC